MLARLFTVIALIATLSACSAIPANNWGDGQGAVPVSATRATATEDSRRGLSRVLVPHPNKVMLILGQDLVSVDAYVKTGNYPSPAGVTTYVSFYNLTKPAFPAYGALGQDMRGWPVASVGWGAGPLSADVSARRHPGSALVIGLNIAEGNGEQLWVPGGLAAIAAGRYDANIRRLARFCKSLNKPVYLRVGYEFDGAWNRGYENTRQYIAAYRRIVDVMRQQNVSNVAYVWQASASPVDDLIDGRRENIMNWYPGDNYVDWLGFSWFNPPDKRYRNAPTQRQLADEVLQLARAKKKPVLLAESAPQGFDLAELTVANKSPLLDGKAGAAVQKLSAPVIWQQWFAPFFSYVRSNADVIRAVAYINTDWNSQQMWSAPYSNGYWGDSRVQANPEISKRWLSEVNDTSFWLHER